MLRAVLLSIAIATGAMSGVAYACAGPSIPKKANEPINFKKIDQALFSRVAVEWTNYYRCRAGQDDVRDNKSMSRAASTHSKNMAKYLKLSHETRAAGQQTLKKRLNKAGIRSKRYSENISQYFVYQTNSQRFIIKDISTCHFTRGGQRIPKHTYASLGKLTIKDWVESPAHRRNSLNPNYNLTGAGLSVAYTKDKPCGLVYVTQTFAN